MMRKNHTKKAVAVLLSAAVLITAPSGGNLSGRVYAEESIDGNLTSEAEMQANEVREEDGIEILGDAYGMQLSGLGNTELTDTYTDAEGRIILTQEETAAFHTELQTGYVLEGVTEETSQGQDEIIFDGEVPEVGGGACGKNLTWNYSNGILTIEGTGAMAEYSIGSRPWESYVSKIKSVVIKNGATSISAYAFYECANLQTVTIPSSVATLGSCVFAECGKLESVSLPAAVTKVPYACFANCAALQSISMPGVTQIEDFAFQDVTKIDTFKIGKKLTTISARALLRLAVKSFTVETGNSVYSVKSGVLYKDGGKTLVAYPLRAVATSFAIPSGVTTVGANAFWGVKNLQSITIPSTVKTLETGAFADSSLKSVTIPNSVTTVGEYTFFESAIESITFGTGLKDASYQMFESCENLTTINFGGLQTLGARCFAYCSSLETVTLPSGIKSIGNAVFGECTSLKTVTIQGKLDCIPFQAFLNCYNLENLNITGTVPSIYRAAFYGCNALDSVTLPRTTTYVHPWAFLESTTIQCLNPEMKPFGKYGYRPLDTVSISGKRYYSKAYEVLELVNQERTKRGLNKLYMNSEMLESAMVRAAETTLCFSHTRPDSSLCFELNMDMTKENIAAGQLSAESVMSSWMNSEGHRDNILSGDVSTIGIGCFYHNGTYYWVQCFSEGDDTANCKKPADTSKTQKIQIANTKFDEASIGSNMTIIIGEMKEYSYSMKLSPETLLLAKGNSVDVTALLQNAGANYWYAKLNQSGITWTSSNNKVATVSSGNVTAKENGTATIKAGLKYYSAKGTVTTKEMTKVEQFVSRLYTKCLGRGLDSAGLNYWNDTLVSKQKSGAEVGYGFVFSDEYEAKNASDRQFITMLYQVFMDREPDQAGLGYWEGMLKDGVSREYVYRGFATSQEYTDICTSYGITRGTVALRQARDQNLNLTRFVTRIYDKALSRSWDENGLNYWCEQIQCKQQTPVQVAENFINSKEFMDKNLNDTEYVKVLYRTFMGREADKSGLDYWVGRLNKGENRKSVLKAFAGCPEFQQIVRSFGL